MSGALHAIVVHYLGDADGDGRRTGMGNTLRTGDKDQKTSRNLSEGAFISNGAGQCAACVD